MALVKMGGIVTEIAGSVGGSTFRRSKAGIQLYNKVFGNSYSQNSSNNAIARLNYIIQSWSNLSPSDQALWNTQGLRFTRKDKFGNTVNYTGRELYIAYNNNVDGTSIDVNNPSDISSSVAIPEVSGVSVITLNSFVVEFDNYTSGDYAVLQVQVLGRETSAPVYKRYRILAKKEFDVSGQLDFINDVEREPWFAMKNQWLCCWFSYINDSGWRSSAVPVVVQVEGI